MELGVKVFLSENIEKDFENLVSMGFKTCQLDCWDIKIMTDEMAQRVNEATKKYDVTITAFWCGWSGPQVWDFYSGPHTLGIVPSAYRDVRLRELKIGSDFAKKIGVRDVVTHLGFLPEVPSTTEYNEIVCAIRDLANYMKNNGQYFLFETGQETPITVKRVIEDVGTKNLGINLDPANLILYGKANPVDALDVFGEYVRGIHAKDGLYPTDAKHLGKEVRIGEGKVNFPAFIAKLKEVGYDGAITIEREISGDEQIKDIKESKIYLEKLI